MGRAGHFRTGKTGADFEALAGRQGEERFAQVGFQLVEDRLPQTDRDATDHGFYDAA